MSAKATCDSASGSSRKSKSHPFFTEIPPLGLRGREAPSPSALRPSHFSDQMRPIQTTAPYISQSGRDVDFRAKLPDITLTFGFGAAQKSSEGSSASRTRQ